MRYCLNNDIHEEFVGIAEAQSLDAGGLTDTIISQLRRIDVNMEDCVGQGYDGERGCWSVEWSSKEISTKKLILKWPTSELLLA